jgi:hypothetical protein
MLKHEMKTERAAMIKGISLLDHTNLMDFCTMTVYAPMTTLIEMNIADCVKVLVSELQKNIRGAKRHWNYALFLKFTHVLLRTTWWRERFPSKSLLKNYLQASRSWMDRYNEDNHLYKSISQKNKKSDGIKHINTTGLSRLDIAMQFGIILKEQVAEFRQVLELYKARPTRQTEHIYMLATVISTMTNEFQCPVCGIFKTTQRLINLHTAEQHQREKPHKRRFQ